MTSSLLKSTSSLALAAFLAASPLAAQAGQPDRLVNAAQTDQHGHRHDHKAKAAQADQHGGRQDHAKAAQADRHDHKAKVAQAGQPAHPTPLPAVAHLGRPADQAHPPMAMADQARPRVAGRPLPPTGMTGKSATPAAHAPLAIAGHPASPARSSLPHALLAQAGPHTRPAPSLAGSPLLLHAGPAGHPLPPSLAPHPPAADAGSLAHAAVLAASAEEAPATSGQATDPTGGKPDGGTADPAAKSELQGDEQAAKVEADQPAGQETDPTQRPTKRQALQEQLSSCETDACVRSYQAQINAFTVDQGNDQIAGQLNSSSEEVEQVQRAQTTTGKEIANRAVDTAVALRGCSSGLVGCAVGLTAVSAHACIDHPEGCKEVFEAIGVSAGEGAPPYNLWNLTREKNGVDLNDLVGMKGDGDATTSLQTNIVPIPPFSNDRELTLEELEAIASDREITVDELTAIGGPTDLRGQAECNAILESYDDQIRAAQEKNSDNDGTVRGPSEEEVDRLEREREEAQRACAQ